MREYKGEITECHAQVVQTYAGLAKECPPCGLLMHPEAKCQRTRYLDDGIPVDQRRDPLALAAQVEAGYANDAELADCWPDERILARALLAAVKN